MRGDELGWVCPMKKPLTTDVIKPGILKAAEQEAPHIADRVTVFGDNRSRKLRLYHATMGLTWEAHYYDYVGRLPEWIERRKDLRNKQTDGGFDIDGINLKAIGNESKDDHVFVSINDDDERVNREYIAARVDIKSGTVTWLGKFRYSDCVDNVSNKGLFGITVTDVLRLTRQ